jgi:hypothetical protein
MMAALIVGLWCMGVSMLLMYAYHRDRRIQAAQRDSAALAAKAGAHCECSMVCNHCGRYKVYPDNSVR